MKQNLGRNASLVLGAVQSGGARLSTSSPSGHEPIHQRADSCRARQRHDPREQYAKRRFPFGLVRRDADAQQRPDTDVRRAHGEAMCARRGHPGEGCHRGPGNGCAVGADAAAEQLATPLKLSFAPLAYARKQVARQRRRIIAASGIAFVRTLAQVGEALTGLEKSGRRKSLQGEFKKR